MDIVDDRTPGVPLAVARDEFDLRTGSGDWWDLNGDMKSPSRSLLRHNANPRRNTGHGHVDPVSCCRSGDDDSAVGCFVGERDDRDERHRDGQQPGSPEGGFAWSRR